MAKTVEHIETSSHGASGSNLPPFLTPDLTLAILTWVTFFALLAILHKYAWNPILKALDEREASIRKSLEDADRIQKEMSVMDEKCAKILAETQDKAAQVIDQSRKAARDAAAIIEQKAKEEAKISLENALRDIKEESQKAQVRLREESARIAVDLAGKLIEENLDTEKNKKLVHRLIKEI